MGKIDSILIIFLIFVFNISLAQAPTIAWQKRIGGSGEDNLYSIQQTRDGGYILGGTSESGIWGDKTEESIGGFDYWVVKLNSTGQTIEWQSTIGRLFNESLKSIQQTIDGGYILGGSTQSAFFWGDYDYGVVKLDSTGQMVWQNIIGGTDDDVLHSIQQTTDGEYILGGYSKSGISGDKTESNQGEYDYWVIKLDGEGNIIWQNTIGGNDDDLLHSIQLTTDGGYILGGTSKSGPVGDKTEFPKGMRDYWVVKLDGEGNIIWQNTISGSGSDKLNSIQQTTDGGYILGGYSSSGISGDKTEKSQGGLDYWVVKLDKWGNIFWQNTIGGSANDHLKSIQQTTDGGYILGGYSESGISGDKIEESQGTYDYWVVKLYPDTPLETEQLPLTSVIEKFTILPAYPNPFNPKTTIRYGLERDSFVIVEIYDIVGQLVSTLKNENQTQGWQSVIWNGTNQQGEPVPAGLYFSKLTSDNKIKTIKLLLLK